MLKKKKKRTISFAFTCTLFYKLSIYLYISSSVLFIRQKEKYSLLLYFNTFRPLKAEKMFYNWIAVSFSFFFLKEKIPRTSK